MPGRPARRPLWVLLGLLLAAGLLFALLPEISATEAGRQLVASTLSRLTGYEVEVGSVSLGRDLSLTAGDVALRAHGAEPFFRADGLDLAVRPHIGAPFVLVRADVQAPQLYVDRLPLPGSSAEAGKAEARGPWLPLLDVSIRDGVVHHAGRAFGPIALDLTPELGAGPLEAKGTAQVGGAGNELRWTADVAPAERRVDFAADGEIADLPELLRGVAGVKAPKALAGKVASLHLEGSARAPVGEATSARLRFAVDGAEAHNGDFSRAVQGVKASGLLEVVLAENQQVQGKLELEVPAGEALWDRFYLDLAHHTARLRIGVRDGGGVVRIEKSEVELGGLFSATASGTYDSSNGERLAAKVYVPDLTPLYRVALQEPFHDSHPMLSDTAVGGALQARLELRSGAKRHLTGELQINDGRVENESSLLVRDLTVELPFLIGAVKAEKKAGFVSAGQVSLGGVDVGGLRLDLLAEPDALSLAHPVRLQVLGGTVDLNHLSASDLSTDGRRAKLGVSLYGLDLRDLSRALGGPPLTGTISGAIPDVTIANGNVRSDGEIAAKAFDGVIRIRDLRFDQIVSPVPELALDASFEGISLGELTSAFEVGHVSGIVQGAVDNLVVVHGEPVKFDAWMETVDAPGVAQKISVTALRQLSILGGSDGDPISRGLLSLFDEYGYAKMGFRCQLRNDRFVLHGVQSSDNEEILVVGSFLPPRVNVVSHNQVIAFSEMVERLKRAARAGGESAAVPE